MAIVNITPDSFFDASRTWDEQSIAARVQKVITEGASIIDIGGYSSRPGADEVTLEEELSRVERALAVVKDVAAGVSVSVDTFRSRVAQLAIEMMGEVIINDISAGEADPAMVDVVAHYGVPYVAMHMRGTPQTMQGRTAYERGVVEEVTAYFDRRTEWLISRGVKDIIVDPGFGFAKSLEQNYELLAGLGCLCQKGFPVLVGLSRKSMVYNLLAITPAEALNGTTALHWEALRQGAAILRVHDVREAMEVVRLHDEYKKRLPR
ncbi:MAG: dihydropteroate synthase [Alistipes sp.]|nr:dihydropteroate synthase [Alistipes sp.]